MDTRGECGFGQGAAEFQQLVFGGQEGKVSLDPYGVNSSMSAGWNEKRRDQNVCVEDNLHRSDCLCSSPTKDVAFSSLGAYFANGRIHLGLDLLRICVSVGGVDVLDGAT